ncbi:MAG: hypothetical protein JSS29_11050 [Proteobacteria bacterium]|nr:hypothetical protein [Pseudomonadota bacterium]
MAADRLSDEQFIRHASGLTPNFERISLCSGCAASLAGKVIHRRAHEMIGGGFVLVVFCDDCAPRFRVGTTSELKLRARLMTAALLHRPTPTASRN